MEQTLFDFSEKLAELKAKKKEYENSLKDTNSEIKKTEYELALMMSEQDVPRFDHKGHMFYVTTQLFASAKAERREELFEALKENGYEDMVQETVNANSLRGFIREQIEENDKLPEWLDGLVNVHEEITVGMRKAAK